MRTAYYPFQFGVLKVKYEDEYVAGVECIREKSYGGKGDEGLRAKVTLNNIAKGEDQHSLLSDFVFTQISEYLTGKRKEFSFPYQLSGTKFQKSVWDALCQIPYGETRTYGEIAKMIGRPKASRAVGAACGANPVVIAVPCHRVVGSNGALTGFAYGVDMKKTLLEMEAQMNIRSDNDYSEEKE